MAEPEELAARIGAFAAEHHLQENLLRRWSDLAVGDGASLLALAETLRLGENHLRDILDWAEEIALRDETPIAAVLSAGPVRAALGRDLGRNESIKAVREALRRLRFPRLVAVEDELARRVRALALPSGVRLLLPPNLQDTEVRLEIRAADVEAVRAAVDALQAALQRGGLAEIFALLAEAP